MSNEEEEVTPSRTNTNKMIRVLTGKGHQKFTVTVHHKDGTKDEFQSMAGPTVSWQADARALWIVFSDYPNPSYPIMPWHEGDIISMEQNPDWKEK